MMKPSPKVTTVRAATAIHNVSAPVKLVANNTLVPPTVQAMAKLNSMRGPTQRETRPVKNDAIENAGAIDRKIAPNWDGVSPIVSIKINAPPDIKANIAPNDRHRRAA